MDGESPNSGRRGSSEYYDSSSDTDDVDNRYVLQSCRKGDGNEDVLPEYKRWRLKDIQTEVPPPPTLPSHTTSPDLERTNSDDGGVNTTAASVVREVLRCGNCRREFNSMQDLHGHMRVHALRKHRELDEKQPVNCASTGKHGRKGSKAVIARFAPKDQFGNSVGNVLAQPVLPIVPPITVEERIFPAAKGGAARSQSPTSLLTRSSPTSKLPQTTTLRSSL
ncbi:hypothetical protein GUJ93_ZPchr0001g29231 [Zizania palustris]|uniref:C2H2-type domain-containing protein n=1 Tax=Zizania palustris TaxID=103762 RepID=A0A8J5VC36_ZIZPA|nr:hypothetical protein GUJ93_ZPchr0001g29231 [Zizania palustris]